LRRPVLQTANRLAVGGIAMDLAARAVTRGGQEVVLTPREFAVLEYLLRHPGQALSRTQIAERVWSWEFHGDSNIVDVYIGYLRRKLDTAGEPSAIETLRGFGYRLRGEARDG
jgi:DNA-binding response OmpR family regulator